MTSTENSRLVMAVSPAHSDTEPFLKGNAPSQGLFTIPSRSWNATNLQFIHDVAGKEIKENPGQPHTEAPNRFPVPIENTPDLTDFVYGEMPQALTLRPKMSEKCCGTDHTFEIARDMFADSVAQATIDVPKLPCCFAIGMQGATVEVTPSSGNSGVTYKGTLKRNFLPQILGNQTTLVWEEGVSNKPQMAIRGPSCIDNLKMCMCATIWVGWRGTSESHPQTQVLYDNSLDLRCMDACTLFCMQCQGCKNACCLSMNFAPRFVRPQDMRMVVATKYDYEFAWKHLKEDSASHEVAEGEDGQVALARVLQPAHRVDALYTGRLLMDVSCMKPHIRFAGRGEGNMADVAGVDARYRGSVVHGQPSEEDHLIVLAGLIMHGLNTFPNQANAPYGMGPAVMNRGKLVPRLGGAGAHTSTSQV